MKLLDKLFDAIRQRAAAAPSPNTRPGPLSGSNGCSARVLGVEDDCVLVFARAGDSGHSYGTGGAGEWHGRPWGSQRGLHSLCDPG